MDEAITDLKRCIKQYRDADNDIRVLNKMVHEKRESRKIVELELTDLVKLPQFAGYDKLKIEDDGSTIKIQKPETYSKPWSLSKKELQNLLDRYFQDKTSPNSKDCFEFICNDRKAKLIATEYSFARTVREEDN
jgi:phage pi2 protein 07